MDIDAKKEGTLDGKYKESKTIELRECAKKIDDTTHIYARPNCKIDL